MLTNVGGTIMSMPSNVVSWMLLLFLCFSRAFLVGGQGSILFGDANLVGIASSRVKLAICCDFIQELKAVLTVPEVVELVGVENVNLVLQITDEDGEEKVKPILKSLFTDIMSAGKERVAGAVDRLRSRLHKESQVG